MRTSTFWRCVAPGSLMICAATTAAAGDTGPYLGGDAGIANYPGATNLQVGNVALTTTVANDDTDITSRLMVGFRFSRYFALEAGYVDLGEVTATLRDAAGTTQADLRFMARGPALNAIGSLQLGKWDPFIKVGMFWQNVHLNLDGASGGTPFSFATSADGMKIVWGTGVGYSFNEHWHVKAAFDYSKVGDENRTGRAKIHATTLGIAYRF
jgi:OmpA-OmpF porin, OOP family